VGTVDADACVISRGGNGAILVNGEATNAKGEVNGTSSFEIAGVLLLVSQLEYARQELNL
jgi:hypothetical protein